MAPKIFGWEHILYIVISFALTGVGLWLIKKYCKTEKSKKIAVYVTAGILLASIVFNRVSIAALDSNPLGLVPTTTCGFTSLVFAILTLSIRNRNHSVFHFIIYLAFGAGLVSVIYCDFIGQASSIWYPKTISGLLHHSVDVFLALLLYILGEFRPSLKKWWCFIFGACAYVAIGLFFIQAFGFGGALWINSPVLPGLYWYILWPAYFAIVFIGVLIHEFVLKKIRLKQEKEPKPEIKPEKRVLLDKNSKKK